MWVGLAALAVWLGAPCASAAGAAVVVEIDGAAERVVDARSARRLVPLELSDVQVPQVGTRGASALFFRVLGRADGSLRIELWERGEYHGQRALNGAGENPQLVARRVALAAAELVRRLARKRQAAVAREQRLRSSRAARDQLEREKTQEGPLALRSEAAFGSAPGGLLVGGSRLNAEATLRGALRLDFGAELWAGRWSHRAGVLLEGLSLAPAHRFALTRSLDVDTGVRATALLLQVPSALSLDGIREQDSSWTARVDGSVRLQLRLSREVRAALGAEGGALLRTVHLTTGGGGHERLRGLWWGASLGVVITPKG